MKQIKTLVIGGAGFIGSYLIEELLNANRVVTVLGRGQLPQHLYSENITYVQGDFANLSLMADLIDHHAEIIHLAYATIPSTSHERPMEDLVDNLEPALKLFKLVAEKKRRLILVSSGGTVYGQTPNAPIPEVHPTNPISVYGVTKLTIEHYALLYRVTHGLDYICIRPANAYGPRQRPHSGQGFISTAMASAISGTPIKIFGMDGVIRDYIYVKDVANGIVFAMLEGMIGETYNIGTGIGRSNIDVINAFKSVVPSTFGDLQIQNFPSRDFDVKINILDSTKLKMHTQWQPLITFEDGLERTYSWLLKELSNGKKNNH